MLIKTIQDQVRNKDGTNREWAKEEVRE